MDYVAEELWRQQWALARLLLGGQGVKREDEAAETASPLPQAVRRRGVSSEAGSVQGEGALLASPAPGAAALALDEGSSLAAGWNVGFVGGTMGRLAGVSPTAEVVRETLAGAGYGQEALLRRAVREAQPVEESAALPVPDWPEEERLPYGYASEAEAAYGGEGPSGGAGEAVRYAVTEILPPSPPGEADPEALSRVYQRDARRYDGGFVLY